LRVVDFPAPLGPRKAQMLPVGSSKLTESTTRLDP
jgi:hypothetical protein